MPLKSRSKVPPGGKGQWTYFEAKTGKELSATTFSALVTSIQNDRLANPRYASQWSTDRETIEKEVDDYTCLRIGGDPNYCDSAGSFSEGQPTRNWLSPNQSSAQNVAVRSNIGNAINLLQLFGPSQKPVEHELAEKRAAICVQCPMNSKISDWTTLFTKPAAMIIKKTFGFLNDANLKTSQDDKLNICEACGCPLKLKIFTSLLFIKSQTSPETMSRFWDKCWIRNEQ